MRRKVSRAVIDRSVETEFIFYEGAFLRPAGDTDRSRARNLRELAYERPHGAARRRDHHGLARLGLADHAHTAISREPGHPEHAETRADRRQRRVNLAQPRTFGERVRAPSGMREDEVAFRIARMLRRDHFRNRLTNHDIANLERLRIGFPVIHPPAHVWVEREILDLEQNLLRSRRRNRGFLKAEVGQLRFALGSGSEDDLPSSIAI